MKEAISPKDFAEAIGVSESSVKRWVDQGLLVAARTAGGHRRISRDEALRWLRENQTPVLRPDRLGLPDTTGIVDRATPLATAAERFFDDLTNGRDQDARGVVAGLFLAGHSAAVIADDVIRPALTRIGTLWEHGEDGIFVEHRATAICIEAVQELRGMLPETELSAGDTPLPVAVGGAPAGDPYLVAPMLATVALTEAGYHAVNLGPDTPIRVLELAAQRLGASLVFLSLGSPLPERTAREIQALGERLDAANVRFVLGGRFVEACHAHRIPGVFVGRGLTELAAFARGLVQPSARVDNVGSSHDA
jgi:excisionase family DNA binding protein